jgi:FimV-like protein
MIASIVNSYLALLLSVGIGSLLFFIVGLYFIFKWNSGSTVNNNSVENKEKALTTIIPTIAGDDIFATQLDLARAYIETGKKSLAKKILTSVLKQGSAVQQREAKTLLELTA